MKLSELRIIPIVDTLKILDITDEEYFGLEYRKYISNSKLTLINPDQDGSPQIYYDGLSAHPKYMDSMVFGSAVHEMVLQPNEFQVVTSVDRPTAKLGFMADELFKTYWVGKYVTDQQVIDASDKIDYYKGKMDDKKIKNVMDKCRPYWEARLDWEAQNTCPKTPIYLDPKSREKLNGCLKSVANNKKIQSLLHPDYISEEPISQNEACLLLDVRVVFPDKVEVILPLKAKIDNFTIDFESNSIALNDLKTTGHLLEDFEGSFFKYHYYRQMGMYGWMLKLACEKEWNIQSPSMTSNMLLVSTIPTYKSGVFRVYSSHINKGVSEFAELLKRVAYHERFGYDAREPEL